MHVDRTIDMASFTSVIYTIHYIAGITGGPSVTLDVSNQAPKVGDDIELTCHVQTDKRLTGLMVRWMKESEGVNKEVATNTYLNGEFKETGRFRITMNMDDAKPGQIDVILHITGKCNCLSQIYMTKQHPA